MGTNQNPWPAREMKTNQKPTPNPSTEGNQLDVSQPRNSRFSNFSCENILYKQCNSELGAPPCSCCVGDGRSPSSSLVIKTLLLLHRISAPWWSLGDFATWAQHTHKEETWRQCLLEPREKGGLPWSFCKSQQDSGALCP